MTEPIRGKVAKVLNSREIAINRGIANGVTVGMYFDVMEVDEADIIDPDTGNVLGSIERSKVRVQISHVQENLSVASTYQSERVNLGGYGSSMTEVLSFGPFAQSLMPPNWVTEYETLEKSEKIGKELDEEDSYVKTGDSVVQVIEKEKSKQKKAKLE